MGNLLISPPDQRNHGNNRRQKQYNKKEPNENQQKGGKRINGWQPEMLANCVCVCAFVQQSLLPLNKSEKRTLN